MSPVVVQGTAVSAPQQDNGGVSYGGAEVAETNHEPSKTGCKDPIFAILFYLNVVAIVVVAGIYGKGAFDGDSASGYAVFAYAALFFGLVSFVAAGFGLILLLQYPTFMIKCGLIFSVVMSLAWTIYAFVYGAFILGALSAFFFLITLCYVKAVWSRIPFAAINMLTAGTAVKANLGVTIFAIFFTLLEVGWLVLWSVAVAGTFYETNTCDANGVCSQNYGYLFLLFLSLFFTQQVLQSCVHVTVAGTVATWWVAPNESGCCSRGICNSFIRTITTSFGSICFGSLLVAILQALKAVASAARSNDDMAFLACIAECIIGCLASLLEYFNKWAYIYVGVYGYSYLEAGKAVMQLFSDRGWDAVVADDLVGNAIFLVSVIIGLIIGAFGISYASVSTSFDDLAQNSAMGAFFIGFIAGLFICSILLSTVASGVNTVIVMFADAPQEFQENHPELSQKMREVWQEFYPGSVQ